MNWDAIGAVGEIVGAVAVVLSLVYLAVQIRTSSKLAKAQMFQSAASEQSRVADGVTGDPHNFEAWMKMHSGEDLTPAERARANFLLSRIFQAMLAIQIGYDNAQISKEFFLDAKAQTDGMFRGKALPHARKYLERYHPNLKNSYIFSDIVDSGMDA
jgi:hypothetical protein